MQKQLSAKRFWSLMDTRLMLIEVRNAERDKVKRAAIQKKVLANLDKLIKEHDNFWNWNEEFRGVPFAHVHKR